MSISSPRQIHGKEAQGNRVEEEGKGEPNPSQATSACALWAFLPSGVPTPGSRGSKWLEACPLCKRNLYGEGSSHWGTTAGCPKSKPLTKFLTCKDHNNHKDSLIHQRLLNFKPKRVHLGSQLLSSTYCLPEKKIEA